MEKGKTIGVGLIGLSSRAVPGNTAGFWAAAAHLPTILDSPSYALTALCNSSLESAKRAIALHNLDAGAVSAYGDPEALARDENVDVVVCSINVEKHYDAIKPAIVAGKMVICEWPLAANLQQMEELTRLAEAKQLRTAVGLQGRFSDCVQTIKTLVTERESKIGRVLSSSMVVHSVMLESSVPEGLEYFCKKDAGGNTLTIRTIHLLDMMTAAIGDIETYHSTAAVQRKTLKVVNQDGEVIDKDLRCDTPDHILLQGKLEDDVIFSYQLRTGRPFKNTPVFDWRIYGEKAEIRITSNGTGVQMDDEVNIQVYDLKTDSVSDVDILKSTGTWAGITGLEGVPRNTSRLYAAFVDEDLYQKSVLSFRKSLKWARLIEDVYRSLEG